MLKIGNVELNNNIILGPMAGLTDRPFRIICEKYNPGLVVTEMVSAKALMYNDEKTKLLLNISNEKRPISVQIFGSDTEAMAFAAKYICERKIADIIDINLETLSRTILACCLKDILIYAFKLFFPNN